MKTKPIPIIITLAAALISCVISIVEHVDFSVFVSRLLVVVLVFLTMGTIIKMILDYSFRTLEPTVSIDEQMDAIMPDEPGEEMPQEDVATTEENPSESEEG
ncbi:MAG: hypothetical protein IJ535_00345 [Pseudobutyrivibrio sp.]|uniref:hypothetical protein n=1 Tax=Pseudobutyrivibrio sp. TaxID=2014367 RepID=UPI0026008955|nr:hypothetical protein [Pseudobutyrivibrio sp.]MBQ8488208.1 hypothetical protein [Pseudobutyrivibrio sp.]